MKRIINHILNYFGLEIIKKSSTAIVPKKSLISFRKSNFKYRLYFEGLNKSNNNHTDNFWKQSRYLDLMNLVEKVLNKKKLKGDFVELGCWKGHSAYIIAKMINKYKENIKFHIFDSFEGLSETTPDDHNLNTLFDKKQIKKIREQFKSNEDFVKNEVLKNFNFIKTYKGWIPEKFQEVENLKFSFIHIDLDLYDPTLKSLEFFFPRLQKGGVIICDDYNSWEFDGSKKAWDYFFSKNEVSFNFAPSVGGSFIIK